MNLFDHKKREMESMENNDVFKAIFDSASNGIAVMKPLHNSRNEVVDFSISMINKFIFRWIGNVDYHGRSYTDIFPGARENGILPRFIQAAETGITADFEQWYNKDGVENCFRFIAVQQGEMLVVTIEDVSDSKKSEAAVKNALDAAEKQKRLYNSITSNTPDLMYVFDLDYKFIYANKALLAMWGKSEEDAIGLGLRENGYEEWHALMHEREIDEVAATKNTIRGTVSFPHAELGTRVYDYIFGPIINENGEVEAIAGTTRDITEIKQAEERIINSESRFRALTNASSDVIYSLNADWSVMYPLDGRGFLSNTNEPLENWMEANVYSADRDMVRETFEKSIADKTVFELQHRVLTADGEVGWTFSRAIPLLDGDDKITEWFGAASDITERVETEQALKLSESRFRNVINTTPVGTAILIGPEMKIEIANDVIIKYWSKDAAVVGKALLEAIPELVGQPFPEILRTVYETGAAYMDDEALAHFINSEGEIVQVYFNYSYTPLRETDGTVYGVLIMAIDVTKEITSRKQIEDSESRFRLLSDEMPQFVWTGDAEGNLFYFNNAVYKYSGLTEKEAMNGGWTQIVHPDDIMENIRLWEHSVATGEEFVFEHRFRNADGEYRWQLSRAVPLRNEEGIVQQWIGTSTDIQEQKDVNEELEKLVNLRTKELQRSNEDLQQFAHVASHDLKEPVRKIKTFANRLETHLHDKLDDSALHYMQRIHVATDRMFTMIDGVLAYSTTNAGKQKPTSIDLNDLISAIEIDLEVPLQAIGGYIQYDNLPKLEGAQVLIYQLFYNLINNSIKFARAGVPLEINVKSETTILDNGENAAKVILVDNGIGFDQEHSEKIFDTFTRLNAKDKYEGTGLGLALCKKIAERHNGTIKAESQAGSGASFTITLPLHQRDESI